MKKTISVILVIVSLGLHGVQADEVKRSATVIDTAGTTSEVTDLRFSGKLQKFDNSYGRIAFFAEPFHIAVPMDRLVSIEAKGDKHTITYLWHGKEMSLTGSLFSGEFTGKSDFGDLKLSAGKLKSLKFDRAPKPADKQEKPSGVATLTLADGTTVHVGSLKRHDSYYSSEGYIMGGSTRYSHYTDFRFLRGESLATVSFDKIKQIDLTGEKDVTVVLKNGKKASGTLSSDKRAGIDGWTAVSEKGEVFLSKKQVKAIDFSEPTAKP